MSQKHPIVVSIEYTPLFNDRVDVSELKQSTDQQ